MFYVDNVAKEISSTQLLIKIKDHNYSDILRLYVLSHLQAVVCRYSLKMCYSAKYFTVPNVIQSEM